MLEHAANVSALRSQSCIYLRYFAIPMHLVTLHRDSLQFCYLTITKEI